MQRTQQYWFLFIAVVWVLAACGEGGVGSLSGGSDPNSSPQLTLEQADQVAETFLTAWRNGDFAVMYNLISPNSRDAYSPEAFLEEYQSVASEMTATALDTQLDGSLRQGTTAAIQYDVTFQTELFGEVVDADRTMRLIETPEGWRVAWSRMDILADLAEGARLVRQGTQPNRGNIYDRNGNVLVDQNGRSVLLYLVRRDIVNESACITALSRILRREITDLQTQFNLYLPETLFQIGEIDVETYQAEEQVLLELCDVGDDANDTRTRTTRRYFGELAPHVVGYIGQIRPEQVEEYAARGYPDEALIGQAGIEQSYEKYLAGQIGAQLVITAPTGETLRTIAEVPAEPGQSVYLTIDRNLQMAVQEALVEAYNFAQPTWARTSKGAAAVVMNVKTGEVLAMASYPQFNPSLFNPDSPVPNWAEEIASLESDPRTPLLNRATQAILPLGSVFKIVSVVTGMDTGVINKNSAISCTGTWYGEQYGDGLPFRTDWLPTGHGYVDLPHALTFSCDPYFWELGVKLQAYDPMALTEHAYEMGLGVPTGQEDVPEEIGQVPNEELIMRLEAHPWYLPDTLNLVIGQGPLQVTPLQVTRMVAAIANGGTLWEPQFVKKVQLLDEPPVLQAEPTATAQWDYAPEVYDLIQQALCEVTTDPVGGTANYIFGPWYDFQTQDVIVCGKTGTAQTGGETTKPEAWFAAFAPQDDPEIAIVVQVQNSCEGSEVSAPIVRRIVEDYYGLPHYEWPDFWLTGCYELGE